MCVFFILSGFLSGYFYHEDKTTSMLVQCIKSWWKQIKKFYPFYFVFVLVGLFIHRGTMYELIENVFLIQSWFGTHSSHSFNPPTWFLSSIMLSYFLAPVINKLCYKIRKYGVLLIFVCVIVQVVLASYFSGNADPVDFGNYILYTFPPTRMIDFIEGVLLSLVFISKKDKFLMCDARLVTVIESFSALIYIFLLAIKDSIPINYSLTAIWAIPSMLLVWVFASSIGKITIWCNENRLLQYLGKRSYELYIAHRLVLWFFAFHSRQFMKTLMPFIITIIIAELATTIRDLWKNRKNEVEYLLK